MFTRIKNEFSVNNDVLDPFVKLEWFRVRSDIVDFFPFGSFFKWITSTGMLARSPTLIARHLFDLAIREEQSSVTRRSIQSPLQ